MTQIKLDTSVKKLLEALGHLAQSRGMKIYAVGGCVRDWILGDFEAVDLDICVEGDGIAFAKSASLFLNAGLLTHEQFGTATLSIACSHPLVRGFQGVDDSDALRLDIASCRREVYAKPASYPKVTSGNIEDDLFRRDFTINAMALSLNPETFGSLVDPYRGFQDLKKKKLRVLHRKSFIDDPSRILRAVRFMVRYSLELDPDTKGLLVRAASSDLISGVNEGRVKKELKKIITESDRIGCLYRLGRLFC